MTSLVERIARQEILQMQGYSSARMNKSTARILLNANESPWPPFAGEFGELNRYPQQQPEDMLRGFAEYYGVKERNVLAGRGSDELIDLLVRVFCRPYRDKLLTLVPGFGMYRVAADVQGVEALEFTLDPENNFELDPDALLDGLSPQCTVLFLCSPNNPTGNCISSDTVATICRRLEDRALVVVDEAYHEYAGAPSAITLLDQFPNLCVLRTLSKAFALAGLRMGTLVADATVIDLVRKVMTPYPISATTAELTTQALARPHRDDMEEKTGLIVAEREKVALQLRQLPMVRRVFPSDANFLLVEFSDCNAVLAHMTGAGILLREQSSQPGLEDCLRISIGSPRENELMLTELAGYTS